MDMRNASLGVIGAALLLGGPAVAADLAVQPAYKAPPLAPAYNWTGFYVGATIGGGWTNEGIDNAVTSTACNTALIGCGPANFSTALAAAVPGHISTNSTGLIGGGEAGYNWQTGRFVWGVETDLSGANINGSSSQSVTAQVPGFPANTVSVAGSASEKLDLFGTVRARLGFLVMPQLLLFGTGGLAYGHASATTSMTETVGGTCFCGPSPTASVTSSSTMTGWTAGGGLEWMFVPQWTLKGEYLYYDLGTLNAALPQITQLNGSGAGFFGANVASSATVKGSIARVGLNYKF
jgi:outer membrane immunogenic protein